MSSKTYNLSFDGYWLEAGIGGLPERSGIYCVYVCSYNRLKNTVSPKKLIYIGESEDVRDRIANHEKWSEWRRYLQSGEELCFSAALINGNTDRERTEAAMIYKHKPPCNTEYKDSFPYDETTVRTSGRKALLHDYFTVYPTPASRGFGGTFY